MEIVTIFPTKIGGPPTTLGAKEMILRVTAKLGRKIGISPPESLPADPNPFADWTAHLFTADRVQYILIANTQSLYSMVMYGKGITTDCIFLSRLTSCMSEFIRDDGYQFIFERLVAPAMAHVSFSKTLNRAVTGSINDLVFQAKVHLVERQMSPYDVSFLLNDVPMSYLKYDNQRKAFRSLKPEDNDAFNNGMDSL